MSTDLPLERRLHDLYSVAVPATLDRRLAAAIIARPVPSSNRIRRRWVTLVAAAAVVATVAAGPVASWFSGWGDRYDRLWALGAEVDQTVTADAYRVTVHRAYADALGIRLAMSAVDLEDRWSELFIEAADVTDADGRAYPAWNWSPGQPPADATATAWSRFVVPSEVLNEPPDGDLQLRVTVTSLAVRAPEPVDLDDPDHIWTSVGGDWTFDVVVPVTAGVQTLEPEVTATKGDVTVSWQELELVPSGPIARLSVNGLPELPAGSAEGWYPVLSAQLDGQERSDDVFPPGVMVDGDEIKVEMVPYSGDTRVDRGSDVNDLTGHWRITITNFWSTAGGQFGDGLGPWVLEFDVPPVP